MNTCGQCFWFDPITSRCVADDLFAEVIADGESCNDFIKAPEIINKREDGEQE